jgi:hypothetical protein
MPQIECGALCRAVAADKQCFDYLHAAPSGTYFCKLPFAHTIQSECTHKQTAGGNLQGCKTNAIMAMRE